MALDLEEAPAVEPVSVDDAKQWVRSTSSTEQALFADVLIPAARERAELATQRQLLTATWRLRLDTWPCEGWIEVPRPPLQEVVSIVYVDTAGTEQTLDPSVYRVETPRGTHAVRGRITLAYAQAWPALQPVAGAVVVTFKAGYGDEPADVPARLRQAILRDIGALYEHREDVVTGTITAEMPRSSTAVYRSFRSRPVQRGVL